MVRPSRPTATALQGLAAVTAARPAARFDVDESGEPSAKPAGSVRLADIENVKWPAHGEHHGKRARIQCFAVEADAGRHVFAAPSKAWCALPPPALCGAAAADCSGCGRARHFVQSVRDLGDTVSET